MDKLNPFSNSAGDSTQNPTPLPPNPSVNMPGSGMTGGNVISGVNNITSIPPEGIGSASLGLDETPNDQSPDQKQATADQQVATATFQAEHPNRTTSSVGRGAIKLVNDEPRSNKKWLFIVLGILGVLVVIGSIVVVVMNATGGEDRGVVNSVSAKQAFTDYEQLLVYGPANNEDTSTDSDIAEQLDFNEKGEWYFLNINELGLDKNQKDNYLKDIQSAYGAYLAKDPSTTISNEEDSVNFGSTLTTYLGMLTTIINYYKLPYSATEVAVAESNSINIINEKIPQDETLPFIAFSLVEDMRKYLELESEASKVYRRHDCVKSTGLDVTCVSNIGWDDNLTSFIGDEALEKIKGEQTLIQTRLDSNFLIICGTFRSITEELQDYMGVNNG